MKLADVKKAAEKKYAPLEVELEDGHKVFLRIPIRLSKEERKAINRAFDIKDDDDDQDIMDIYEKVFRIVVEDDKDAEALISALEGDLSLFQELFDAFADRMQTGEASSSKS